MAQVTLVIDLSLEIATVWLLLARVKLVRIRLRIKKAARLRFEGISEVKRGCYQGHLLAISLPNRVLVKSYPIRIPRPRKKYAKVTYLSSLVYCRPEELCHQL